MRYLLRDNSAAIDRSGRNRKMSQSLAVTASIFDSADATRGAPDGIGEQPGLRAYNPTTAGRAGKNPHRTGSKIGPQILHPQGAFSWERQLT